MLSAREQGRVVAAILSFVFVVHHRPEREEKV